MAIALVANGALRTTTNNNVTTAAIDTTGATLLVVVVADQSGVTTTLADSKTNSWTGLTVRTEGSASEIRLYYAANPTVGSGHTFTATSTGAFPALAVLAFSGVTLTSPFDVENGATQATGTSMAAGNITPGFANEVLVGGLCLGAPGITVSSVTGTFTLLGNLTATANAYGVGSAYEIQTTATARNLTWTLSGGSNVSAAVASFKAAVAGGTKAPPPRRQPWRLIRRVA